ncbi:MAG: apolipoprotein N-acyltransferase [Armatimonadota bacterium]|nr:apolipoprotein N-acyltransferase [Armatimonadota bacterium]
MPRPRSLAPAWRLLGALASGVLLTLAFPGADVGWLVWIALVPLLVAIREAGPGEAFGLGFAAGLVAYGGLVAWVRLFGLPAWAFVTVGMAAYLGAFAGGAAALVKRWGGSDPAARRRAWLWVGPLTWMTVEFVRSVGPLGFPWGLLGLTQYRTPGVLALAPLVGVFGIGAVVATANTVIATFLARRRPGAEVLVAALIVVAAAAGANMRQTAPTQAMRRVAAVQPNVDPRLKGDPASTWRIIAGLLEQTAQARAAGAEVIVYPETAVPLDLRAEPALRAQIASRAGGAVVVVGTYMSGPQNGVLVLDAAGRAAGIYAKRRLVPFGEAGVRPGTGAAPIRTPAGAVGVAICYESSFPDLVRPLAGGADLIAILTNDGWFGTSAGPAQHAAHAVLRAAETGRSIVRAANTGTSMLIRPDGTVIASQALGTRGVLVASLPVGGAPTPYVRWGWLLAPAAAAAWALAAAPIALGAVRRRPGAARALVGAVLLPAIPWMAGRWLAPNHGPVAWPAAAGILVACLIVSRGHLAGGGGAAASLGISLAATGLVILAMRAAYARYGFEVPVSPPDGRWLPWMLQYAVHGVAMEVWLRGAVFAGAVGLGGWPLAVVLSTLLGVGLQVGQAQEVLFWHLFSGAGFGAVRLWTRDAAGLGPARGVGDAVMLALAALR